MKYEVRNKNNEVLLSNTQSLVNQEYKQVFFYEENEYLIYLETENKDEKKSTRNRKIYFSIIESASRDFIKKQQDRFNRYNHIIQTISAQIIQKMEGYLRDEKWHTSNYIDSLENIKNISSRKPDDAAKLVHYFNKMSLDLKSHIEGWEIIYINDDYVPVNLEFSLKRAILNQYSSFSEEFNDLGIEIKFSDYFDDSYLVSLDKKLFSLIMYNFFSNALKYSKPTGSIRFNYSDESKDLDISMYSTRIEKNEISSLFEDGVRGSHANKVSSSGFGVGLFVIKKGLDIMGLPNMYIDPQYAKKQISGDVQYFENHFKFKLQKYE